MSAYLFIILKISQHRKFLLRIVSWHHLCLLPHNTKQFFISTAARAMKLIITFLENWKLILTVFSEAHIWKVMCEGGVDGARRAYIKRWMSVRKKVKLNFKHFFSANEFFIFAVLIIDWLGGRFPFYRAHAFSSREASVEN